MRSTRGQLCERRGSAMVGQLNMRENESETLMSPFYEQRPMS